MYDGSLVAGSLREEISSVSKELTAAVELRRERDFSREAIKYLYIDGTIFPHAHRRIPKKFPSLRKRFRKPKPGGAWQK